MRRLREGVGRNVWGIGVASFFTDLAGEMIAPLLPIFLLSELGATMVVFGSIEGIADSGASLLRLISGWLSDRVKKRKIFVLIGYGVGAAMRPLLGLVTAVWHVGVIRIADRLGKGIRVAPRDALIADSSDPAHRGKAFGLQRALDNLGGVGGMLIAVALLAATEGDFRTVFLLTAIPAACVLLAISLLVRDRPPSGPPAKLKLSLRPFGPEFRAFLLAVTVFTLGNPSHLFVIPRLKELGLDELHLLMLVWCGHTLIRTLAAIPAGIRADRWGRKRMILVGWLLYVGSFVGFGMTDSLTIALVLTGVYALYWSLAESVLRAMAADLTPPELRGTAYGMVHFCVGLAVLPANLAFGFVWDA